MKQSNKQNTIKVTKPVAPTLAGTLGHISEDTSGWGTDSSGNVVDRNRLLLSRLSSTTLVNAENLYPDLWARANVNWRSGSDLIIPPQQQLEGSRTFGCVVTSAGVSLESFVGLVSSVINNGTGDYTINWKPGLFANGPFVSPYVFSGAGTAIGATVRIISSDASSTRINVRNDVNPIDTSVGLIINERGNQLNNETKSTPVIQLVDNIAAGALGLPEATATEAGVVTTQDQTFAGDKTFTGKVNVEGPLRNTEVIGAVSDGSPVTLLSVPIETDLGYRLEVFSTGGAGITSYHVSALIRQRFSGSSKAIYMLSNNTLSAVWNGQDLELTSTNINPTSFRAILTKLY